MACSVLLVIAGWIEVQRHGVLWKSSTIFQQASCSWFLSKNWPLAIQMLVFLIPIQIRTPRTPSLQWQLNHCWMCVLGGNQRPPRIAWPLGMFGSFWTSGIFCSPAWFKTRWNELLWMVFLDLGQASNFPAFGRPTKHFREAGHWTLDWPRKITEK